MQSNLNTAYQTTTLAGANKVLRDTYALLAVSLIPTIIGAGIGVNMSFAFLAGSGLLGFFLMLAGIYGLMFAIQANRYSNVGVALMLVFTFLMGVLLGPLLQFALHLRNGAQLIMVAGGGTACVFFVMAGIATTTKKDLSGLGKFLTAGAIVLIIAMIANAFLRMPALQLTIASAFILFSSLMIMWEVKNVVDGGERSHVAAALSIYISIYNLFTSLLQILIALSGDRR
jgi:modulator of FtsH protease